MLKGKGTHRTKETNHTSSRAREQCEAIDGHVCACVCMCVGGGGELYSLRSLSASENQLSGGNEK